MVGGGGKGEIDGQEEKKKVILKKTVLSPIH
jgi:hypothetical protein